MVHLTKLNRLEKLDLGRTRISSAAAASLGKLPALKELEVVGSGFGPDGIQALRKLNPKVRVTLHPPLELKREDKLFSLYLISGNLGFQGIEGIKLAFGAEKAKQFHRKFVTRACKMKSHLPRGGALPRAAEHPLLRSSDEHHSWPPRV